ncbi:MAG: Phosphoesterase family protein, partial [Verrucomicrobiales bacterium]|nr:Phosphoesterase family protein [Verrucomicrobiales bacterium]
IPMKKAQFIFYAVLSLSFASCAARSPKLKVAPVNSTGVSVPVNQTLTPAGIQIELTGARPQVIAVSPDCQLLVTSAKNELVVLNPQTGQILDRVALPRDEIQANKTNVVSSEIVHPDTHGQASYNGLTFSRDGKRIYLSNVQGDIKVFAVEAKNKVRALYSIKLPRPAGADRAEIPAGLALSTDGQRLYVAGNLSNRLLEIDLVTGKTLRTIAVGALPYDVAVVGDKVFVSNWGGRQFVKGEGKSGPAGQGTTVRVDPVRFIANEGSVSVVDAKTGTVEKEIVTGARATGLAVTPDQKFIAVANVGADSVSVIDVRTLEIVETISLRWQPKDLFGASPDALVFDDSGKRLYVCNATQNAIAAVDFSPGKSRLVGLIPTGWFPGAIDFDQKHSKLCVANVKGMGSGEDVKPGKKVELNSHQWRGTIEIVDEPSDRRLAKYTQAVLENYGHAVMEAASLPARDGVAAKPVPERVGEPSVFKHVLYIIKENRTYDQVLGDMKEGNGDPRLCIFGEKVTPNQHKLAREFVLLDDTRCSGAVSADGHQWTDSAFATDYIEKSFAGFPRSYPYYGDDAMAYSPAGFLWDNAIAHGKTFRDYGEFTRDDAFWSDHKRRDGPHFLDCYRSFVKGTDAVIVKSWATVPSLTPYLCTNTTGFKLNVPDVWRAGVFLSEFKQFEKTDTLPELMIFLLPSDHTAGTKAKSPTPAAKVADNDLAFGQIVDAISHSKYWKDTCIFAIEDDPQMGFDHVSSYRTTAYVASAYTKRHAVVHTPYNQTSLVRTIELMLGLPPMNQLDATATPMFDCFMDQPDLTAFAHVKNNIPLDQMNSEPRAINDKVQRKFAIASAKLPLDDADECPEDLFNRILWNAQRGNEPYPAWAVSVTKKTARD